MKKPFPILVFSLLKTLFYGKKRVVKSGTLLTPGRPGEPPEQPRMRSSGCGGTGAERKSPRRRHEPTAGEPRRTRHGI